MKGWKLWSHLSCRGLALRAHFIALAHVLRGHKVAWFRDPDPWMGHFGWIWCEDCPDTEDHVGLVLWGHDSQWFRWLASKVCGWLGHPGQVEATKWAGEVDEHGEHVMAPCGDWFCSRCAASMPTARAQVVALRPRLP